MTTVGQRTIDLEEIQQLLDPHIYHRADIRLHLPDNHVEVTATVRAKGVNGHAARVDAVHSGNAAIAAIEAAGYEHASVPQINIGGMETPRMDSEACDYLVQAELSMELIGKRDAPATVRPEA